MGRARLVALLLLAAALYGYRLGVPDFWGNHWESRRALIARDMLESGTWAVPRLNGKETLNKPPLYYWIMAGTMALVRDRGEIGARLPSAAAAVAGLALAYRWGTLAGGGTAGLMALLVLLGNVLYFGHARTAEMDMLLLAVETAAALAFLESREREGSRSLAGIGWMLLAAGFMIKGPVGLAVPAAVVAVYAIADRRTGRHDAAAWIRPLPGLAVFAVLALPWYLWALDRVPGAAHDFFRQTATRVGGGLDHREPIWFYLPVLAGALLPATFLVPAWVSEARASDPRASHLRRLARVVGILFVLFSLSGSKRVYYVLPLWPVMAVGLGVAVSLARERRRTRWLLIAAGGTSVLLVAAALGIPLDSKFTGPPFYAPGRGAAALLAAVVVFGAIGIVAAERGKFLAAWGGVTAAVAAGCLFIVVAVAPVSNAYRSRAAFAREMTAHRVPAGEALFQFGEENFALPFYAGRIIPVLRDEKALCAAWCGRRGAIHVILGSFPSARFARSGIALTPELVQEWSPPAHPERVHALFVARVDSISCACP